MGYNLSRNSVKRHLPQLEQLFEARSTLYFATQNPSKLAYKFREALTAAAKYPEYQHFYNEIWPNFQFKTEPGSVIAEFVGRLEDMGEIMGTFDEAPTPGDVGRPTKKTLPSIDSLVDVVGTALKFDSEHELYFPSADFNDDDMTRLYTWATEKGWKVISHFGGGGVTLTKREVAEEVTWKPPVEETTP